MDISLAKNQELNVNMSNHLIRMAQGLRLSEKRVVAMCMAQLDSVRIDNTGRYKFRLSAQDYAQQFKITPETAYEQMKEAGNHLLHRIAQQVIETKKGNNIRRWQWVSFAEYQDGEGWIKLTFNHEMTPHLFLLRKEFTSYKLEQASALRSIYSWRLFELLMQFKKTGLLRIGIDEFCHAIEASESAKKNFAELDRTIIKPAIKELEQKNNFSIELKKTKVGRRVIALEFKFKQNPQPDLF